ncbi:HesA/MoeB/ThiF family protein [Flavihumibacter sp. UBA7668]|uniref:HesA/MoeB/ThiF family protein n=1 Tax=Flavihumibacter sp. UBA7668 TaxID=1946542 RepID=UPI0025BA9A88|nr:HesA/MoeB/ThiF family protein [Flavihumibacter sp. UBA7668]
MKTNNQHINNRYQRQIILKGFGQEGQEKLAGARILVIGAGGLGCPALLYLAAAGIGTIGIVDFDLIQESNLHRQVLFNEADLGHLKVSIAAQELRKRNSEINIHEYPIRLEPGNCLSILEKYDFILDGTDNFSTRYMINDACVLLKKPLIMGAISQFEGQVAVLNAVDEKSVNYRDIFPEPPQSGEVLNCAEAGVLGVLPGIIGVQMANEVIKLITGIGSPLVNQLYTYDALTNNSQVFELTKQPAAAELLPATREAFEQTDYEWLCGEKKGIEELDINQFYTLLQLAKLQIIDVREYGETPIPTDFEYIQIPLSELKNRLSEIDSPTVIVFCQSGIRSKKAGELIKNKHSDLVKIYNLSGGMNKWTSFKQEKNAS